MIRLHQLLIGFVLITFIVAGVSIFISTRTTNYAGEDYNATQIDNLNKMNELNTIIQDYNDESLNVGEDEEQDILGSLFTQAYTGAQVFKGSIDVGYSMVDEGVDSVEHIGGFGGTIKTVLTLLLTILVVVGIMLAFITKSDRT